MKEVFKLNESQTYDFRPQNTLKVERYNTVRYGKKSLLRSIKARFSLIVAHFRSEIFYWLVQKNRSLSPQKPAIIQFHDQK